MKPAIKTGFTIVETMLFLAITAFLIMGVLIGTGTSINIQRYHDSVSSLQSFFQEQYSEVANVDNDIALDTYTCPSEGEIMPVGQSNCVILGKFIKVPEEGNASEITTRSVIGTIPTDLTSAQNDTEVFTQYNIQVSPVEADTYDLEWGANVAGTLEENHGQSKVFSMLILRSPVSGIIRTFVYPGNDMPVKDSNIKDILGEAGSLTKGLKLCVDSNGLFTGARSAVIIAPNATSSSGIEKLGDTSGC